MANFVIYILPQWKNRKFNNKKERITDYTTNTLIKDNLEYTVLSKSQTQNSVYFMTATSPLQKKSATPGTLNPEIGEKDKYNL